MASAIKCGNCGGFFTTTEVAQRKPPRYPWVLTASGQKVLAENQQRGGEHTPCPNCGNQTLLVG
ncbi:MAG: hypothetical protein JWP01_1640 [Myxococcales bacterium]|nr:hypothetical protein [Myxococcales bacterium]